MSESIGLKGFPVFPVLRFTEKPELKLAQEYVATGNYHWNAGMFFWRVSTFLENLKQFLPKTYAALEQLSTFIGTRSYERKLRAIYRSLKIFPWITRSRTGHAGGRRAAGLCDSRGSRVERHRLLGAVHGLLLDKNSTDGNVFVTPGYALDASGNLISCPGKIAALIGVHEPDRRGYPRRAAGLPARPRAGRRQNREMAGRTKAKEAFVGIAF